MLNVGLFTYSPISSFLLISKGMKISTKGSSTPFTTWDRYMIPSNGKRQE